MLEYENFVAHYIESTENYVRYRVTPILEGNNLVATEAYMKGFSIEGNGMQVEERYTRMMFTFQYHLGFIVNLIIFLIC